MNLSDNVNVAEFVNAKDELSGADIKALCTEVNILNFQKLSTIVIFNFSRLDCWLFVSVE